MTFHFMAITSRQLVRILTVLIGIAVLVACSTEDPARAGPDGDTRIPLRVMTFNIEWGGTKVSFEKVVEAIEISAADVVGIQEAEGNLQRLASELEWHYDLQNYVVSKFPLVDPGGANGRYAYVEVRPGRIVAIANAHLPSDPYGPDAIRDGATQDEVLALEKRIRVPAIEDRIAPLPQLINDGIPVFLTGDFNTPAHTDWSEATVGERRFMHYALDWPVTRIVAAAGFRDAWREMFPDAASHPGLTWWAGRPPLAEYAPGANDPQDRIDYVWFAGPADLSSMQIVGERDGPEVSLGVSPWPSDHRAVVAEFLVAPAAMPQFVSIGRRVLRAGEDVDVLFNSEGEAGVFVDRITSAGAINVIQRKARGRGKVTLPASLFGPGHYRVVLRSLTAPAELATEFWVLGNDAVPEVEVLGSSFAVGQGIEIKWRNAPGNRNDYLAAYPPGSETDYENGLAWTYVSALPEGQKRLDASSSGGGWPLTPGEYVMRLVKDDGFEALAESALFEVVARPGLEADVATHADGRLPIQSLFAAWGKLQAEGWQLDIIATSQPDGTDVALPIMALRSPRRGPAAWFLAGVHGEEPAGPNALALAIDDIAALGDRFPVVLLPLLNPHGYARNWRYLNLATYSAVVDGNSVGDSSHFLPDPDHPAETRGTVSSPEAEAISRYILHTMADYPPRYSIDLHEENLISAGYVYSQGALGAADPLASVAVRILGENDIGIKMSGQTRFDEPIVAGIVGPVVDSSIDELMSSETLIVGGQTVPGPGARTVLVFETPAADLPLATRVAAHRRLIESLATEIVAGNAPAGAPERDE
jgi:endonuclease/exonuclease/phosphatase family metal-dependent hydrolase